MADVYGVQSTKVYNTTPPEVLPGKYQGAVRRSAHDTYEASGLSAGDKIIVGFIPHGSRLLPETRIDVDALGASTTLQLVARKISDDTETELIAAASTSSAATIQPDIDEMHAEIDGDSYLVLVLAGGAATGTIKSEVAYATQGG